MKKNLSQLRVTENDMKLSSTWASLFRRCCLQKNCNVRALLPIETYSALSLLEREIAYPVLKSELPEPVNEQILQSFFVASETLEFICRGWALSTFFAHWRSLSD